MRYFLITFFNVITTFSNHNFNDVTHILNGNWNFASVSKFHLEMSLAREMNWIQNSPWRRNYRSSLSSWFSKVFFNPVVVKISYAVFLPFYSVKLENESHLQSLELKQDGQKKRKGNKVWTKSLGPVICIPLNPNIPSAIEIHCWWMTRTRFMFLVWKILL